MTTSQSCLKVAAQICLLLTLYHLTLFSLFSLLESDMMSSVSGVIVQKPNMHQSLQAAVVLKTQQQSHYDTLANTASKEANLKFGLLSHTPSQMSNSERIKVTNPKVYLQQHTQFPSFKVKDGVQTAHHEAQFQEANEAQGPETKTGRHGSEAKASREEAEKVEVTQMFASESHPSTTASSTLSLVSRAEQLTSSPPSFSTAHTQAITAITNTAVKHTQAAVMFAPTSPLHHTKSALTALAVEKALKFGEPVTSQDAVTTSEVVTGSSQTADEDQQAESGFQYPSLSQPGSVDEEEPKETSTYTLPASVYFVSTGSSSTSSPASSALLLSPPLPSFSASTSTSPSSTQSNMEPQLPKATSPSNTSTTTDPSSHRTEYHKVTMNATSKPPLLSLSLSRRPVCQYPPVPAHGTFYFRNVENPGPREYRHYIQYACYPGYTLAHGDIHSYCQQGGTWSGTTPVCLGRWC